jgi:hypothetical protein
MARGRRSGPRLSLDALKQLTQALLDFDEMASATSRRQIVSLMDRRIASAVPDRDSAQAHVLELLRTCEAFEGGRDNLILALRLGLPDNQARARVFIMIEQLWPN